jgi:hypothetical protein
MAKISDHDRQLYDEKVRAYVAANKKLLENEKKLLLESKKDTSGAALVKLTLTDEMLNLTSNYIAINSVANVVLKTKNEAVLNDARKALYQSVIYLEEAVSNYIDVPFSDYENKLNTLESFDENQRYHLIRKMGLAIDLLEYVYGDNSKWRWTFVELEGRFATVSKNILDLRHVMEYSTFESPYYDAVTYHLRLVKRLLNQSADRYREKYELSTGQIPDFKTGISYLGALRRLHILLAESEDAENIKKKMAIWKTKLEADHKKQEEAKKRA